MTAMGAGRHSGRPAGFRPPPYAPCEGSGDKPVEFAWIRGQLIGSCPRCRRWIGLTKRRELLVRHGKQKHRLRKKEPLNGRAQDEEWRGAPDRTHPLRRGHGRGTA